MSEVASLRPLAAVLLAGLAVVPIVASHRRPNVREAWSLFAAVAAFATVVSMVPAGLSGTTFVTDLGPVVSGIPLAFRADALGLLFALLASTLWIVASVYSIGYMRGLDEHDQTRYFAAFAVSVAAALGVALSANLVTLFVSYEVLTVATYPLVAHDETDEARAAGRKYLAYTFGGGVAVLAGTVLVYWLSGAGAAAASTGAATTAFTPGGIEALATADPTLARAAFGLLVVGFGVKAALMPLHSWLPDAMVAPTPVSGLLHAVAVVKSGVFGIARVVLDVFGPETVRELGLGLPLAAVAGATILLASVIALRQDNLKRRLAYSTVSQLSYIVLGIALLTPDSIAGGLLHIPAHGFMKLTLFLCAGAIHVETHTDRISGLAGIGRRMPLTMAAFAVASAGMAGIPLVAGFVSKVYLLTGAVDAGATIFAIVLLLSGVLNVAYFWPIVYSAFFESPATQDEKPILEGRLGGHVAANEDFGTEGERQGGGATHSKDTADHQATDADGDATDRHGANDEHHGGPPADGWDRRDVGEEGSWFLVGPILATATGAVVLGVVPGLTGFLGLIGRVTNEVLGVVPW